MKRSIIKNMAFTLSGTWKYEKKVVLFIVLEIIINTTIPLITVELPALVVKGITENGKFAETLLYIVLLLIPVLICNLVGAYIGNVKESYLLNNKMGFLSSLFRKRMDVAYSFTESPEGQNLYQNAMMSIVNDMRGIPGMIGLLGPILGNIVGLFTYATVILLFDFRIILILVASSLLHLLVSVKAKQKQDTLREPSINATRKLDYLYRYVSNDKSLKDIRIFGMSGWLTELADAWIDVQAEISNRSSVLNLLLSISNLVLLTFRDGFAFYITVTATLSGKIEVWEFVLYIGFIMGITSFLTGLTGNLAGISQKSLEIDTFRDFMEKEDNDSGMELPACERMEIEFKNVSFRFSDDGPYILHNINLTLSGNEKVALVGENGAGKTTFVKLLCGFYEPTEGQITVNGIDLKEINKSSYYHRIASVFQDVHILPMTVGQNIAFGEAVSKTREIDNCIKEALPDERFADQETMLTKTFSPNGIIPSGGQEQKLILARAAYKLMSDNVRLLILDEPTAAMDPIAEKRFYETYQKMAKNILSIFISHRLASTGFCDRILVLDKGEIVGSGSHDELMEKNPLYRSMYEIQSGYYK